ncbi:hypothetical protein BG015_000603 [Linnemannia schmuckeri]|uniref:Uncharacterized protein n=1 Tax=Linnemannia schmuckeri TaxID=64567 RepID=A0A9P5V7B4_9FUNG|nr:hypothetical protein BG015_000603 [Linnemannia schmuckeri]
MQKFYMMMAIGAALQLTTQGAPIAAPVSGICNTPHCLQTASNILNDMQVTADPCVDFSQFACGGFNEREKLRPGEKKNGYLVSIDQQNIDVIRSIITLNDPKGPVIAKGDAASQRNLKKLQSYYGACMDNNQLAKVGRKPLQDEIRKLTQLFPVTNTPTVLSTNGTRTVLSPADRQALSTLWGYNMRHGFENPISWDLWDDETNPGYKMMTAQQSGLGLKDEALYNDEKIVKLYEKVIGEMFYIVQGNGNPKSTVPKNWQQVGKDVVAFEMILAGVEAKHKAAETAAATSLEKKRADDDGAEEEETGDGEDGDGDDEDEDDGTIIWDKISDLDQATPSLDWTVIFKNALPADVPLPENINMLWKFYFRRLETALETMPLQTIQNYFAWTLMRNLGGNLAEPLQRPLAELKKALPGGAVTSTRWRNCVQLVNENLGDLAGHFFVKATFPEDSEILAGILRAPFFDAAVPEYLNYAGIGVVAAHELGHAFDNSGRRYDETGAIREWWEESSIQEFDTRSQCFIEQYNEYTIDGPDGKKHNVNGWGTLGENIADNGGLKIAYDAWAQRRSTEKYNNKKLPGLERYTSEQLFFIQYARAHCGNMTPEESVKMLNDDNHSPKKWRINGVVQNSDHFAKAFQCKAGAPMNPAKKCVLL